DAGVEATLVSARSYRTPQPEGTYVYLLRGLGTLFGDFVQLAGRADWYVTPRLTVSPAVRALWQGEAAQLAGPFPENDVPFLFVGDPVRTLRGEVRVRWRPLVQLWLDLNAGINTSAGETSAEGLLTAGFRLPAW
ncbi:MAG: hypothetical protein AAGI08_15545, partial [Bacteroidota bacterium]